MTPPDQAERRYIGTRMLLIVVAVGCYFGTLYVLASEPTLQQPEVWSTFQWLIGLLATTVVGVTARPSDKPAAFGVGTKPETGG